ncbi:hypothetical protein P4S72_00745 [Vibrio sp. PP-XX7]
MPRIPDAEFFAIVCNYLLHGWPRFINDDLVGLPFSGFTVGIDPTRAGSQLLDCRQFNEKMCAVLNQCTASVSGAHLNRQEGFAGEGKPR